MAKGLFIAFEGPDGAGKTTARQFVADFLSAANIDVQLTREPGGTPLAERIRDVLLTPTDEKFDYKTELLLFFAARAQHVNTLILPAVESGKVVLCDRFLDSTYAYQCYGRGIPRVDIDTLTNYVLRDLRPDVTFLFNVDPEVGAARVAAARGQDRMEQEDAGFYAKVQKGYRVMASMDPQRYVNIDANQPLEQVQAQLVPHLQELINRIKSRSNVLDSAVQG